MHRGPERGLSLRRRTMAPRLLMRTRGPMSNSSPTARRTSTRSFLAVPVLLALGLGACGGDTTGPAGAGSGLDGPDRVLDWQPETVYTVGGFEAPEWATFGRVAQLGFDQDGTLYLFDDQTAQVTVVSPEGAFLRVIGRRGDGPGEVGRPLGMTVTRDGRVVIPDLGKRALVLYDAQGEWLGNARVAMEREGLPARDVRATASNRVVSAEPLRLFLDEGTGDTDGEAPTRGTRPVWVYPTSEGDSAEKLLDAWEPPPPPEGGESTLEGGGTAGGMVVIRTARMRAFTPELHVAPLPDGRVAVVDSVDYTLKLVGASGELERLHRPIPPTPVTDGIREMERERRLDEIVGREGGARLSVLGGGGGVSLDREAVKRMLEDQVSNMSFFPEIPVVESMAADWEGRIWVQRSSGVPGEPGPTDVITAGGGYVGTLPADGLRIPDAFGPGGLAAYIELDELDVATVRVVRLPLGT